MSCSSTDKNVQALRQQITANYQSLHAEMASNYEDLQTQIDEIELSALPEGQIFVGDSNDLPAARTMSGDVTIDPSGVTAITAGSIVNADVSPAAAIATTKLALDAINTKYSYLNGSGTYTIPFGARVVETEAELLAALLLGGTIFVKGTITLTAALSLSVAGTTLMGFHYNQSKLVMSDAATSVTRIIVPNAINCTVKGLTIQGNTTGTNRQHGILSEGFRPNSGFTVQDCHITKVYYGIHQTGGETSPPNVDIKILNNKFSNFHGGIYWSWTTDGLDIIGNTIIGDGSEFVSTAASWWNAVWVGLGVNNLKICNNTMASVQRMGLEVFWPYQFNANTAGSADYSAASKYKSDPNTIVANNTIYDCGSMGMSMANCPNAVVANNSIANVRWVGLELVSDENAVSFPNKHINILAIGNSVSNVNAQPRGLNKPYKPTNSTVSNTIYPHFTSSSSVDIASTAIGSTVTFNLAAPYPDLQINKQLIARQTSSLGNSITAKISTYNQTTGVVTATVLSKTGSGTISDWTIFARRTLVITLNSLVEMGWGTNAATATSNWTLNANGEHVFDSKARTLTIVLRDLNTGGYVNQLTTFLANYNPATQQVTLEVLAATGSSTAAINTWQAYNYNDIVGISIDQIDGVLFANNFVDTIVDGNPSINSSAGSGGYRNMTLFGCQVYKARNVYFSNNVFTRAGLAYVFNLLSNEVVYENNKFMSPTKVSTSTGVSLTRETTGPNTGSIVYDPTNPATELGDEAFNAPGTLIYGIYVNSGSRVIMRGNYLKSSTTASLCLTTNFAEVYSDRFVRPEVRFGSDFNYRGNIVKDVDDSLVRLNSPVLDYTQKWNSANASDLFTGYRFHVDAGTAATNADSKVTAFSIGSAKYIDNWFLSSATNLTASVGSQVFTLSGIQYVNAGTFNTYLGTNDSIPVGTFVKGEPTTGSAYLTDYFEGLVTAYDGATKQLTIQIYYSTISTAYSSWRLWADQDAVYVSKTGDLVLRNDLRSDKTVGTKIGQTAAEKFAFWGATPVVQPATVANATDAATAITQLNLVIARLKTLGLIAT